MPGAYVALEGDVVVEARCRAPGTARGELVFTTAYTGYEESLTDPSYEEQVLTFAYPLIGNYGVREERFESDRVHPRAVVARELTDDVAAWLTEEGVPAVDDIDTRDLVGGIRDEGAMKCGIAAGPDATPEDALAALHDCKGMSDHTDIGAQVSVDERVTFSAAQHAAELANGDGAERRSAARQTASGDAVSAPEPDDDEETEVALIDCGAKKSIVDSLVERGATVHVLPYDTEASEIESLDPDVLFISNGPGDPANFGGAQALVEAFVGDVPLAGICLGQQIIARALGGTTEKMPFGHRGVNQPVIDLDTKQVVMTTQNHGYTVAEPGDLDVTQINVNDDTPEGLESDDLQVITRQYHPEANPGPQDTLGFFDDVLAMASPRARRLALAD